MKKLLCIVMTLVLALSLAIAAYASESDGLELKFEADKESYSEGEDVIISLTAENTGYIDISEVSLKLTDPTNLPKGYRLKDKSAAELTFGVKSGSSVSLKAVYTPKGAPIGIIIGISAAVAAVVVIVILLLKNKKGKNLAAASICIVTAMSIVSNAVSLFADEQTKKELSCAVSIGGQQVIFNAEVTYMKPVDNSPKVVLATQENAAPIYIDVNGGAYDGLSLIAEAIASDIEALTGAVPEIVNEEPTSGVYIMAGLVDDEMIKAEGLDWEISPSGGSFKSEQWERYQIKVKQDGDRTKVIVAGTDKRGTIYGLFHITQDIFGISPWIWWGDIKPAHSDKLEATAMQLETVSKRPSVNFRGFFMNDENPCLNGFADSHFGGLNYMFYDQIYVLLLRLNGNYMWPAMWSNNFSNDGMEGVKGKFAELEKSYHYKLGGVMYCDQPGHEKAPNNHPDTNITADQTKVLQPGEYPMTLANAVLADRYGITVGASHHEPMARSGGEWGDLQGYWSSKRTYRDPSLGSDEAQKVWNYLLNPTNLENFWSDAIYRNGSFDNLFTVGMRGENDSALIDATGRTLTTEENIELLKAVLRTQDKILANHGLEDTPALIAVYKEVENCWYGGSRNDPKSALGKGLRDDPDVTGLLGAKTNRIVMLCEDNNGYLRTLPEMDEKDKFNWGLYYHFDYVGSPKTSMWINTMPLQRTWENLTTAYEYGIDDAWIVNVGDLRPMELPLSYFMNLAYDFEKYGSDNPNNCDKYLRTWAKEQFAAEDKITDEDIETIATLLYDYTWLNGNCKPETLKNSGDTSYSLLHYDEAASQLALIDSIIERADYLKDKIGEDSVCYTPFYQLVYYPAVASANVVRIQIMSGLNELYSQRRATLANTYADLVEKYLKYDEELTAVYNSLGEDLNGLNKWYGMMIASPDYCKQFNDPVLGNVKAQAHMNYSSWNGESAIKITTSEVKPESGALMQVDIPTERRVYKAGTAKLPDFESTEKQAYVVNLTNAGDQKVSYKLDVDGDFIIVDGELSGEYLVSKSFTVMVDWDKVTSDKNGKITVTGSDRTVDIEVNAKVIDTKTKLTTVHFPSDSVIAMNADQFADRGSSDGISWTVLEGYGKQKTSVKMLNTFTKPFKEGAGPWLDYNFKVPEDGEYKLVVYAGQGNNVSFDNGTHLNAGIQLDGGKIDVMNVQGEGYVSGVSGSWYATIEQGGRKAEMTLNLTKGEHTLRVWGMDQNLVLQKFVVIPTSETIKVSLIGPKQTYNTSMGEVGQKEAFSLIISE